MCIVRRIYAYPKGNAPVFFYRFHFLLPIPTTTIITSEFKKTLTKHSVEVDKFIKKCGNFLQDEPEKKTVLETIGTALTFQPSKFQECRTRCLLLNSVTGDVTISEREPGPIVARSSCGLSTPLKRSRGRRQSSEARPAFPSKDQSARRCRH